ncbi:MAG: hypothetical protein KY467_05070 [Gemmatimonadetes bacterium]|nr:hypothetical protein [Gemmatimonadota bacterium]
MDQKPFEVEITFRQTLRYAVQATNRKVAEQQAMQRWKVGDEQYVVGSDCCELVDVRTNPIPCDERCEKDAHDAYRYLRDRELVIETLDEDAFNPTIHDAVSSEEVAIHLGWKRRGDGIDGTPDTPRAARALDRLCTERRVVCFTRSRMRAGEKGEIRLYCTPQHLAMLSSLILDEELAGAAA